MATRRLSQAITFALVVTFAAHSAAQSTRVEAIASEQAEKAKDTGVEGPSEVEIVVRRILASPLLSGGDGVYPWFGSVYGGTGMAVGVGYGKRLANNASFSLQTGISLNNSTTMRASIAAPEFGRGMLQVDASAQWLDARGVSFYGFGQDSDRANRDRFDYSPRDVTGNIRFKPTRRLSMTGSYSYLALSTQRDLPIFSESDAPGLDQDLTFHVARGSAMFDWRPAAGYSTSGGFLRVAVERNEEAKSRPYSFTSQEFEAVQLVPLVREQFVLAGHALVTLTQADAGEAVPVILAPYLGSGGRVSRVCQSPFHRPQSHPIDR